MTLLNRNFLAFGGKPITGRAPTSIIVHAEPGVELSAIQRTMVEHAYKLFYDAVKLSPGVGGFLVQNRMLEDGTRIRMEHNQNMDVVHVWPTGSPPQEEKGAFSWRFLPDFTGAVRHTGDVLRIPAIRYDALHITDVNFSFTTVATATTAQKKGTNKVAKKNAEKLIAKLGLSGAPDYTNEAGGGLLTAWNVDADGFGIVCAGTGNNKEVFIGGACAINFNTGFADELLVCAMRYGATVFIITNSLVLYRANVSFISQATQSDVDEIPVTGWPASFLFELNGAFSPKEKFAELCGTLNDGGNPMQFWRGRLTITPDGSGGWEGTVTTLSTANDPTTIPGTYVSSGLMGDVSYSISVSGSIGFTGPHTTQASPHIGYYGASGTAQASYSCTMPECINIRAGFDHTGQWVCVSVDVGREGAVYEHWKRQVWHDTKVRAPGFTLSNAVVHTISYSDVGQSGTSWLMDFQEDVTSSFDYETSTLELVSSNGQGIYCEVQHEIRRNGVTIDAWTDENKLRMDDAYLGVVYQETQTSEVSGRIAERYYVQRLTHTTVARRWPQNLSDHTVFYKPYLVNQDYAFDLTGDHVSFPTSELPGGHYVGDMLTKIPSVSSVTPSYHYMPNACTGTVRGKGFSNQLFDYEDSESTGTLESYTHNDSGFTLQNLGNGTIISGWGDESVPSPIIVKSSVSGTFIPPTTGSEFVKVTQPAFNLLVFSADRSQSRRKVLSRYVKDKLCALVKTDPITSGPPNKVFSLIDGMHADITTEVLTTVETEARSYSTLNLWRVL